MSPSGPGARCPSDDHRSPTFDYSGIPPGYYDRMLHEGPSVQRAWHRQKFARAHEAIVECRGRVLDIGCGPGSFLGRLDPTRFQKLTGIDVAEEQIRYANDRYGTTNRSFLRVGMGEPWPFPSASFDAAASIEVIEHLYPDQIRFLAGEAARVLRAGAPFVLTTPNYASHWPILEYIVGRLSAVQYEEQHVTKFSRFNVRRRVKDLFGEWFEYEYVTTSHFLAPFLAAFSGNMADEVADALTPRHWAWPLGVLLIIRLRRKGR